MSVIINERKAEHISIVNEKDVEPVKNVFAKYSIPYSTLPDIDLNEVDCSTNFLGKKISMPLFIGSMTGGRGNFTEINKNLALSAQSTKIPVALGSMRIILENPEALPSFQVKQYCPDVPVIGNLGLVQLNYGIGLDEIKKIIDETKIDALFFHINHLQEAIQPEGDVNFKGLYEKLAKIIPHIDIPVLAKEVGAGVDVETAQKLVDIGVKYIDVAGLGGTSWTVVEAYRRKDDLGFSFSDVGIRTDQALIDCRKINGIKLIAGGGVRSGLDIIKSLMLGAEISSMARPFLKPAMESSDACIEFIAKTKKEIQIAMFCMGAKNLDEVREKKLIIQA